MTPAELITLINNTVVANGNNEITADVLRPVLVAMVNQINTLVGNEANLPLGSTTVIEAINNSTSAGITIHQGTANPNDTPPVSFDLGDFYNQVNMSSVTVGFWQYNGTEWIQLTSSSQQRTRNVSYILENYTIDIDDEVLIYEANSTSNVVTMPNVLSANGKTYVIVNQSSVNAIITTYYNTLDTTSTVLASNSVLKLISDGFTWRKINN